LTETAEAGRHFIQQIIDDHVAAGRWGQPGDPSVVRTRFPPEPNGYLHIGHAKSICLNFGLAREFGGACVLRFDDTNPAKEEQEYVDAIIRDVRWLGFRWPGAADHAEPGTPEWTAGVKFASDYFQQMYDWARELVQTGKAYVDDRSVDEIRRTRGSLNTPGEHSPHRDTPPDANLELLERMKNGELPDGSHVLRAKIDMASSNMNLRDPVMYRVLRKPHHRTADAWSIYPMYDWAHGLEDSIEGITHSLCTLEFENHRPLYNWFIDAINEDRPDDQKIHHPQQIEFSRLAPTYTIMSKRKLKDLVDDGAVRGWDDPRMPTISGYRRRGYTPKAIRDFATDVGVTKFNAAIDIGRLENAIRDHLNAVAPRRMAVLDPVKVVITNWADGGNESRTEWMDAVNNPEDDDAGTRSVPFTRELYIERDDFMEDAPRKFFRLKPGGEVRLRYAYWITCREVIKDDAGHIVELRCTYDPQTRGGNAPPPEPDGTQRKVKGTLHWVSAEHAVRAEVRLFDRLFDAEQPDRKPKDAPESWSFKENLNPASLAVREDAMLEPACAEDADRDTPPAHGPGGLDDIAGRYQFERLGYFCLDPDSTPKRPVYNRTATLKDSWAKAKAKG
jgi:glutaminyl-tRNA synthetase